jgi:hypothetical protein
MIAIIYGGNRRCGRTLASRVLHAIVDEVSEQSLSDALKYIENGGITVNPWLFNSWWLSWSEVCTRLDFTGLFGDKTAPAHLGTVRSIPHNRIRPMVRTATVRPASRRHSGRPRGSSR